VGKLYLFYIDESGKPNYQDPENFTLTTFIINDKNWQIVDNKVKALKIQSFPNLNDEDVELHASNIIHRGGIYHNLPWNEIFDLLQGCYGLIAEIDCALISVIIRKDRVYPNIKARWDPEEWGYRLLSERICKYMEKKNEQLTLQNQPKEHGIMFIDSINRKYDKLLRNKILAFISRGTHYVQNKFIIEDPVFITSQYRNMSQLCDLVTFCIRKRFRDQNIDNEITRQFEKFYSIILPKFDRDENGTLDGCGLKIFP